MKGVKQYISRVEEAINSLGLTDRIPETLYSPIEYGIREGGKRLRPVLLLMSCDAYCGDYERGIMPAVGIEMFHNFTLLHDDVMDNSDFRRGRLTVHKRWDANTAILSGDTMLTLATELMMNVEEKSLRSVLDIFNTMALAVYEGQRYDMDFESSDNVSLSDYMRMIEGKTGALLGASARIGAVIGGASAEDARHMYNYGMWLGIAFQIKDDYLDLFGDPATFGKPIGGDVVNDKKTYIILSACEKSLALKNEINRIMHSLKGDEKISSVRNVLADAGMPAEYEAAIKEYSDKALNELQLTSLSDENRQPFVEIVSALIDRQK